jgi:mRNA-degrading endonuclease RelE of RelBE toxin-antitoxin system
MYDIQFSDEAIDHLAGLSARQRSQILDAIDEQLTYQPNVQTRNRKLMRPNPLAQWELRAGDLRVFYIIYADESVVWIVAIGIKVGNKFFIGGQEVQL